MSDAEPSSAPTTVQQPAWLFWAQVGFRVAFIYWAFFCLTSGLFNSLFWMLSWMQRGLSWINDLLDQGAGWVGVRFFHLAGEAATRHPTGSGDTALQYVLCLCFLVTAILGGSVWTLLSKQRAAGRREYRTLYAWLRLALRFTLGGTLLGYGFAKVWPSQFPSPSLLTLTSTYGDSSPMKLLWTFMGASAAYTVFGGLAEVIPGVLLLFRRTATLGALLAAGVMLNVVLLNFCYDVPVKLFSVHLLLAALFLLLPDAAALWRIFFTGQAAALSGLSLPPWERRSLRYTAIVLQVVTLGGLLYQSGVETYLDWRQRPTSHSPLYGVWMPDQAEGFTPTDAWSKVVFDRPEMMLVVCPDGEKKWFEASFHTDSQRIDFPKNPKPSALQWTPSDGGALVLTGNWMGNAVTVRLHRINPAIFPLQTRGFHWVQEKPYNR